MYLKASGSGELRAGNFETDSETEILNPDQLIMTLDTKADVEIEANVETGKGYVSADKNKNDDAPLGLIAIDSLFSPVKKVSYNIGYISVGIFTKIIFSSSFLFSKSVSIETKAEQVISVSILCFTFWLGAIFKVVITSIIFFLYDLLLISKFKE